MSLIYYLGQDVGLATTVVDDTGATPGGTLTVTLAVTDPTGAVTHPATVAGTGGQYTAVVPAAANAGAWLYRWTATGTSVGFVDEGQFTVRALGVEQLVDLPSVKAHLSMNPTDRRQDDELQGFILAAADLARDHVGPILPEPHTEWHNGGTTSLSLDWQPVASVLSVTEYVAASTWVLTEQPLGTSTDAYGYTVDLDRGQITRRASGGAVCFPHGIKNIKIAYTAGRPGVPLWAVRLGTLELIRHLWQLTQQGGRTRFGGNALDGADGIGVPTGFALPQRVIELWAPKRRGPGIA